MFNNCHAGKSGSVECLKTLVFIGGAEGIRTPDLLNAIQTRSQLRYSPTQLFLTTEDLARPLAATKFEIRISKYETISNDKKLNAQNFT